MWRQGFLRGSTEMYTLVGRICSDRYRRNHCTCIDRARGTFCSIEILRIFHMHFSYARENNRLLVQWSQQQGQQSPFIGGNRIQPFSTTSEHTGVIRKEVVLVDQAIALFNYYTGHT